ncbi:DUF6599 family protein [Anaerophaga thermohalophila]|uniref:DUF6599 family protein n=1 Tax=Anaerophaga thermohalophila TaxID=177400 RepID=UPI000308E9A6|nr:DUF6599 family protein [Anaerophaga thermohalophila]
MRTFFLLPALLVSFAVFADSFQAPHISGWEQDGEIEVFDSSNLFDHINGASEFYFSYNFQKLWVVRYSKGDAEITLEVYDHGDPVHAYGIYSMERPPEAKVKRIGAQGYYEEAILNFVTGRYYVKMNSYREKDAGSGVLLSSARNLADTLNEDHQLPGIIEAMPRENLIVNSRQFVSNTFMGLEFLGSAYRANYKTDKGKLTMFVIERQTHDEVKELINKYHEFAGQEIEEPAEGDFVIKDPFNGTIYLYWTGKFIIGFSGDNLKPLRQKLLREMKENLGI